MSDKMEQAARVDDPVEHSPSTLGKMAGFAAGIVVGIALVATAPVSMTAIAVVGTVAGAASLGGTIGSVGTSLFASTYVAGDVSTGASTVFVGGGPGGRLTKAARVEDEVACHDDVISTGLLYIFIEGQNATRATEETRCAGKLKENACCPTVWYGGPSARFIATRYHGEEEAWFFWLDMAAGAVSGRSTLRAIPLAATSAPRFHQAYRTVQDIARYRGYWRGGPARKWLERAGAVSGALGDDRSAASFNDAANRLSPEGIVFRPPPDPIPYADEVPRGGPDPEATG